MFAGVSNPPLFEPIIRSTLLLGPVFDRVVPVDPWSVAYSVGSQCHFHLAEEVIPATDGRLWGARDCWHARLPAEYGDSVGELFLNSLIDNIRNIFVLTGREIQRIDLPEALQRFLLLQLEQEMVEKGCQFQIFLTHFKLLKT
jgi:hypothetical protein